MKRRFYYLHIFLLAFLISPTTVTATEWTERKLGKIILKADKAALKKNWGLAVKYGEQVLSGTTSLDQKNDARYINQLKNLNRYYDKAGKLSEVADRIKLGYDLSKKFLGSSHDTTMISRTLYYKLHITNQNYISAIPLVLENLSLVGDGKDEDFRKLHYMNQLYSLYGITKQLEKEERILIQYLKLNKKLIGKDDADNAHIVKALAQNYCRRKMLAKFKEVTELYQLQYFCE